MIMRGPMFPWAMMFDDGSIIAIASAAEESGPRTYIRSTDRGETWKPFKPPSDDYAMPNIQFPDGTAINSSELPTPIADRPGYYKTKRFESKDRGLTGTVTNGELYLPADIIASKHAQHFHGNTIRRKNGDLLTVMQGMEDQTAPDWPEAWKTPFKCYLVKSTDEGRTWKYVSHVASIRDVTGESAKALKTGGWNLWGACEPGLMEVADGKLVCVMRTLNDGKKPLIGAPMDTYRDLFHTLRGNDIYPGSLKLPADKFYSLSEPMPPLIICYSSDGGETWTKPEAMKEARGNMPQLAFDGKILALSAGGLHYPRWGNAINFSLDGGKTWTEPINFAPFFTTGYGGLLSMEPGRFLAFFDYTAPQPWKDHTAHWVGLVEIKVERK